MQERVNVRPHLLHVQCSLNSVHCVVEMKINMYFCDMFVFWNMNLSGAIKYETFQAFQTFQHPVTSQSIESIDSIDCEVTGCWKVWKAWKVSMTVREIWPCVCLTQLKARITSFTIFSTEIVQIGALPVTSHGYAVRHKRVFYFCALYALEKEMLFTAPMRFTFLITLFRVSFLRNINHYMSVLLI